MSSTMRAVLQNRVMKNSMACGAVAICTGTNSTATNSSGRRCGHGSHANGWLSCSKAHLESLCFWVSFTHQASPGLHTGLRVRIVCIYICICNMQYDRIYEPAVNDSPECQEVQAAWAHRDRDEQLVHVC